MTILFLILFSFSLNASNLPGNNALSGDQVLGTLDTHQKSKLIPEDQVISTLHNIKIEDALKEMGIKDNILKKNIMESQKFFQNLKNGKFQPPIMNDSVKLKQSARAMSPPQGKIEKKVITFAIALCLTGRI